MLQRFRDITPLPSRSEQYDVLKTLGRGTYGHCYKVRHTDSKEVLVMKAVSLQGLSEKDRSDTLNEARLMQELSHENVIRHVDSWCENQWLFIVMEYAEGGDLGELVASYGSGQPNISENQLLRYIVDIAKGLQYLHSVKVLHRDIKPSNIFITGDKAIIADLGLGRRMCPQAACAYSKVGTPLYFSPELCEEQPYNEKSDVWSFGCLIHELATGQPPFIAANQVALARKVVTESPPLLPSKYSPELGRLIQQMLRKKPEERVSVEEILQFPIIQRASWQLSNERRGIADKDAMEARLREEMRRQFEEQLVQAKEDLQRSHEQKLSAMEQAMHIQAHDMRALLAWQEEGHKKLQMELQDAHAQILHVKDKCLDLERRGNQTGQEKIALMDTMKQLDAVRSDLEEALRTQQNEGAMHKAKLLVAHESLELQKKATEAEKQEMLRERDHMVCVQSELQEALKRVTSKLVDTEKACLMLHEDLQAEKRRAAELELQVAELTTQVSKRNHDITEEVEYPRQQLPKHQQRPRAQRFASSYDGHVLGGPIGINEAEASSRMDPQGREALAVVSDRRQQLLEPLLDPRTLEQSCSLESSMLAATCAADQPPAQQQHKATSRFEQFLDKALEYELSLLTGYQDISHDELHPAELNQRLANQSSQLCGEESDDSIQDSSTAEELHQEDNLPADWSGSHTSHEIQEPPKGYRAASPTHSIQTKGSNGIQPDALLDAFPEAHIGDHLADEHSGNGIRELSLSLCISGHGDIATATHGRNATIPESQSFQPDLLESNDSVCLATPDRYVGKKLDVNSLPASYPSGSQLPPWEILANESWRELLYSGKDTATVGTGSCDEVGGSDGLQDEQEPVTNAWCKEDKEDVSKLHNMDGQFMPSHVEDMFRGLHAAAEPRCQAGAGIGIISSPWPGSAQRPASPTMDHDSDSHGSLDQSQNPSECRTSGMFKGSRLAAMLSRKPHNSSSLVSSDWQDGSIASASLEDCSFDAVLIAGEATIGTADGSPSDQEPQTPMEFQNHPNAQAQPPPECLMATPVEVGASPGNIAETKDERVGQWRYASLLDSPPVMGSLPSTPPPPISSRLVGAEGATARPKTSSAGQKMSLIEDSKRPMSAALGTMALANDDLDVGPDSDSSPDDKDWMDVRKAPLQFGSSRTRAITLSQLGLVPPEAKGATTYFSVLLSWQRAAGNVSAAATAPKPPPRVRGTIEEAVWGNKERYKLSSGADCALTILVRPAVGGTGGVRKVMARRGCRPDFIRLETAPVAALPGGWQAFAAVVPTSADAGRPRNNLASELAEVIIDFTKPNPAEEVIVLRSEPRLREAMVSSAAATQEQRDETSAMLAPFPESSPVVTPPSGAECSRTPRSTPDTSLMLARQRHCGHASTGRPGRPGTPRSRRPGTPVRRVESPGPGRMRSRPSTARVATPQQEQHNPRSLPQPAHPLSSQGPVSNRRAGKDGSYQGPWPLDTMQIDALLQRVSQQRQELECSGKEDCNFVSPLAAYRAAKDMQHDKSLKDSIRAPDVQAAARLCAQQQSRGPTQPSSASVSPEPGPPACEDGRIPRRVDSLMERLLQFNKLAAASQKVIDSVASPDGTPTKRGQVHPPHLRHPLAPKNHSSAGPSSPRAGLDNAARKRPGSQKSTGRGGKDAETHVAICNSRDSKMLCQEANSHHDQLFAAMKLFSAPQHTPDTARTTPPTASKLEGRAFKPTPRRSSTPTRAARSTSSKRTPG